MFQRAHILAFLGRPGAPDAARVAPDLIFHRSGSILAPFLLSGGFWARFGVDFGVMLETFVDAFSSLGQA